MNPILQQPFVQIALPIMIAIAIAGYFLNSNSLHSTNRRIEQICRRLDAIEVRLGAIEMRLGAVERKVDALELKAWR